MSAHQHTFTPAEIAEFWEHHPCGDHFVDQKEWREFFEAYDMFKYAHEQHIPDEIRKLQVRGKRLLEIGLGQGAEAQELIKAGAVYNGVDLTKESIDRVRLRCSLFDLPYESLQVMNAETLDFPDESFDVVFSHGVIHHSPRVETVVGEIYRVLRHNGIAVIMLYHRNSVNYQISISIIRRLGIMLLFIPGVTPLVSKLTGEPVERLRAHLSNLRDRGLSYLRMDNFIHKATDGPENVYSSVYNETEVRGLFSKFRSLEFSRFFFNERHFPVVRSLLTPGLKKRVASKYGWHLWVKAIK